MHYTDLNSTRSYSSTFYALMLVAISCISGCTPKLQKASLDTRLSVPSSSEGLGRTVSLDVIDERESEAPLNTQAKDLTPNQVLVKIKGLLQDGLRQRGYTVVQNRYPTNEPSRSDPASEAQQLTVSLTKLRTLVDPAVVSNKVSAAAEIRVGTRSKRVTFSKTYKADAEERVGWGTVSDTSERLLNEVLRDVLSAAVTDPKLNLAFN